MMMGRVEGEANDEVGTPCLKHLRAMSVDGEGVCGWCYSNGRRR